MNYKKEIDRQRHYRTLIDYNIEQIKNDLMDFNDKDDKLITEYQEYERVKQIIDKAIKKLQPWYRRLLGRPY